MFRAYAPAIDYERRKIRHGILSKEKPSFIRDYPTAGREEERVLLIARFENYILANTHLSLTEEDRLLSMEIILQEATRANKPLFCLVT